MAKLVNLSEAMLLALHALTLMAKLSVQEENADAFFTTSFISERLGVSRHHLSKVMQQLARCGLVESSRGPHGGFRLIRKPEKIKLADVYQCIENCRMEDSCLLGKRKCTMDRCFFSDLRRRLCKQIEEYFAHTSIVDLLDDGRG